MPWAILLQSEYRRVKKATLDVASTNPIILVAIVGVSVGSVVIAVRLADVFAILSVLPGGASSVTVFLLLIGLIVGISFALLLPKEQYFDEQFQLVPVRKAEIVVGLRSYALCSDGWCHCGSLIGYDVAFVCAGGRFGTRRLGNGLRFAVPVGRGTGRCRLRSPERLPFVGTVLARYAGLGGDSCLECRALARRTRLMGLACHISSSDNARSRRHVGGDCATDAHSRVRCGLLSRPVSHCLDRAQPAP